MQLETSFLLDKNKALIHSCSSEIEGGSALNLLNKDKKSVWLTEEDLPQHVTFDISNLIKKPPYITGFGIFSWHTHPTNPKLVEILISKDGLSFITLGHFELSLSNGIQILSVDKIYLDKISYIKFIIKQTHGGFRTYINKIYFYQDIPLMTEYVLTVESKGTNIPFKSQGTEVMISDSDISDKLKNMTTEQILNTRSNYSTKKQHETSMQMDTNNINIITDYDNDNDNKLNTNKNKEDNEDNALNNYIQTQNGEDYLNTDQEIKKEKKQIIMSPSLHNEISSNLNNQINYISNPVSQIIKQQDEYQQEKLITFESRISNLENDVSEIKIRLDQINQNVETLVEVHNNINQNNYNYILNECKKIVNNKIGNLLCTDSRRSNNTTNRYNNYHHYMSNNKKDRDRDRDKNSLSKAIIETSITSRLDQKFSNFCSQIEARLYNSVLKPTMEHFESNLQTNLTEVQNQLKSAEKKIKQKNAIEKKKKQEAKLDYLLSKVEQRLVKREYLQTYNPKHKEDKSHDLIHITENKPPYHYTNQNKDESINTLTLEGNNYF